MALIWYLRKDKIALATFFEWVTKLVHMNRIWVVLDTDGQGICFDNILIAHIWVNQTISAGFCLGGSVIWSLKMIILASDGYRLETTLELPRFVNLVKLFNLLNLGFLPVLLTIMSTLYGSYETDMTSLECLHEKVIMAW